MNYAILRTQKLKSPHSIQRSLKHAFRAQETPNADPQRTHQNEHTGAQSVDQAMGRAKARLPSKTRSNAVLAIEYLITASPEAMASKSLIGQNQYFRDALEWLKDKHGAENVVYSGIHRDETTPHMYAYVVPIDAKGKLNCRAFLGGAGALSEMQTDFAEKVGRRHGLERGIEGSKARHTTVKDYYARAGKPFEPLPPVKTPERPVPPEPDKPGFFAGREAREDYAQAKQEHDRARAQRQQRANELRVRREAAEKLAKQYEVKAREADALKAKEIDLKRSNGDYARKNGELTAKVSALEGLAKLFTPAEVAAAKERRRELDQRTAITVEMRARVAALPKLLKTKAGAVAVLAKRCIDALQAIKDPEKVDWRAIEAETVRESIGDLGHPPERVLEALGQFSPGCADPARRQAVKQEVEQVAPRLQVLFKARGSHPENTHSRPRSRGL